jgi:hypothetical protein
MYTESPAIYTKKLLLRMDLKNSCKIIKDKQVFLFEIFISTKSDQNKRNESKK